MNTLVIEERAGRHDVVSESSIVIRVGHDDIAPIASMAGLGTTAPAVKVASVTADLPFGRHGITGERRRGPVEPSTYVSWVEEFEVMLVLLENVLGQPDDAEAGGGEAHVGGGRVDRSGGSTRARGILGALTDVGGWFVIDRIGRVSATTVVHDRHVGHGSGELALHGVGNIGLHHIASRRGVGNLSR